MIKRRGLLGNASDYVQNGLFIHLDGIDKFADGDTVNWHDLTGNGYNAIVKGTNISYNSDNIEVYGTSNSYLQISKNMELINLFNGNYTYEAVIALTDTSNFNDNILIGFNDSDNEGMNGRGMLAGEGGRFQAGLRQSGSWSYNSFCSKSEVILGEVNTYTVAIDSNTITIYKDGALIRSVSVVRPYTVIPDISIGCMTNGHYCLPGKVYSFRLYNRILNNIEIKNNFITDKKRFMETENA